MTTTAIKERPILFSGEMVRAILDGRKTETRRVVKLPQGWSMPPARLHNGVLCRFGVDDSESVPCPYGKSGDRLWVREKWKCVGWPGDGDDTPERIQYQDGTVREISDHGVGTLEYESWCERMCEQGCCDVDAAGFQVGSDGYYDTEHDEGPRYEQMREAIRWRPSIHMPRWASRITLQITDVRVERVQEIDNAASLAEGVEETPMGWKHYELDSQAYTLTPRSSFCTLWDSINGDRDGCSWSANPYVWVVEFERLEDES